MSVVARFFVQEVRLHAGHTGRTVVLSAATRGPENKVWSQYTPSGQITMSVNGTAGDWFQDRLGKEIGITFTDIGEPEEG
jgi:hypothetical protein